VTATVNPEDLLQITEQVWESYLDPEGTNPLLAKPNEGASDVVAAVSVTGAWRGHVVVQCSMAASRHVAAALLGAPVDEVTEDDIADALGELANIIGGNVKVLLPESCALSLPYVLTGTGAHWPAVTEICRLEGTWLDEPVTVTVLESTSERIGATAS
jgi:chemotaxis protein CheX